jgi:sulfide:quinone oxidoreductase
VAHKNNDRVRKEISMKKLLILGAGTAGTMVANRLSKVLDPDEWRITLVDQNETHYYQPGLLFIPFGIYSKNDVIKPKRDFIPSGAELIMSPIEHIDPEHNQVKLERDGRLVNYDVLVIATGCQVHPEQTPGLKEHAWRESIHEFYTIDGALALARHLRNWQGGRMVVNVVETPIKCPVAPLEFLMLADWFFHDQGLREKVDITYATPLPGAFTKPVASRHLGDILEQKGIKVVPDFMVEHVDPDAKKIVSYDEQEIEYDLLVSIPLNMGDDVIAKSGLGDELNFIPVDKHTFCIRNLITSLCWGMQPISPPLKLAQWHTSPSIASPTISCVTSMGLRCYQPSMVMPIALSNQVLERVY